MESINLLLASGYVERMTLRIREDGTPVCMGSLRLEEPSPQGIIYRTWIQCEAYAKTAEVLGECERGDAILVQGKLFWRRSPAKTGEDRGSLTVLVQRCHLLTPSAAEVAP